MPFSSTAASMHDLRHTVHELRYPPTEADYPGVVTFPDYAYPISTGPTLASSDASGSSDTTASFAGETPIGGVPCSVTLFGNVTFNAWRQVESTSYEPPAGCPPPWTSLQLDFHGEVAGVQYDRVGALWLGGVELLRTTTPEPTGYDETGRARRAVRWHIARSLRHYQALFLQSATVEMSIPNIVNANYTGNISVSASLTFVSTSLTPPPEPSAPVPSPLPLPLDEDGAHDDAMLRDEEGAHDDAIPLDEEGAHDDASEEEEEAPAPIAPPEVTRGNPRPAVLTTALSRLVDVSIAALAELPPANQIVPLVLSSAAASNGAVTPWERLANAPNMSTVMTSDDL